MENNTEFVVVRGRKVRAISIEELQYIELLVSFLPTENRWDDINKKWLDTPIDLELEEFRKNEAKFIEKKYAEKHSIDFEEFDWQVSWRKRKSVWNVIKIPTKDITENIEKAKKLYEFPRDDIEAFRAEHARFVRSYAEKYGLKVFEA